MLTGKPKIGLPCAADQKFAGVREDHLLVSMKPADLRTAVENLSKLLRKGLRYPIVSNSLTTNMWSPCGLPKSYEGY